MDFHWEQQQIKSGRLPCAASVLCAELKCLTFTFSNENHLKSVLNWKVTSCKLFLVRLIGTSVLDELGIGKIRIRLTNQEYIEN